MMNAGKVKELRAQREHLQTELKRLKTYLEDEVERVIDGGEDSVDAASDLYEREKTLSIIGTLEKRLSAIEHALQLAVKGEYGICEVCHLPIDPARLEAVPSTTTCVRCQEKLERSQRRRVPTALAMRGEE